MDGRHGIPALLRQLADSIEDGAIPVKYFSVNQHESDDEDIADGADPDDVTIMVSIGTRKQSTPIPSAFYNEPSP